ncbi:MAG: flippase-like domain-containing protein [Microthrixaceae bacterium]|nr:flippase-like domain-containing protein [Microthrixaceae bacterium]
MGSVQGISRPPDPGQPGPPSGRRRTSDRVAAGLHRADQGDTPPRTSPLAVHHLPDPASHQVRDQRGSRWFSRGGTLGYRLFTEAGVAPTSAGFAMATVGLGSAVVLNLLLWVALLISIPLNGYNPLYAGVALVGVILLASAAALVYLLMEGRDRAEKVLRSIARRLPYVQEETASRFVHQLADRLHDLARQPQLLKSGVLWASANWLLEAASLWVFLMAFGAWVNPINLIVAYGLAGVLAAIPVTPGGLGVVEAALTPTLVGFGVPAGTATIAVLCWRFVQFWLPIPLGGTAYLSLRFGALGRQKKMGTVRDLAHETGRAATRRVWDDQAGEYRWVKSPDPAAGSNPPEEPI